MRTFSRQDLNRVLLAQLKPFEAIRRSARRDLDEETNRLAALHG